MNVINTVTEKEALIRFIGSKMNVEHQMIKMIFG